MLGAFSVQKGSFHFLSALAFPLVLCVFRGEILELSITSTLKSNIQHLTSNLQYLKSNPLNIINYVY
ncbi:hypothetical protein D1Z97_08215 [Riemerella anatipestifer]|nr:hypothetical protein [Riemerella anatipestifer]MRN03268.1 hypothetical protein [Riemerella anatipestifer]